MLSLMFSVCHSRLIAAALLFVGVLVFVIPAHDFKVGRGDLPPALECECDEELAEKHSGDLYGTSWSLSLTVFRPHFLAASQDLIEVDEAVSSAFLSRGPPMLL
jgi:hypothetical protein